MKRTVAALLAVCMLAFALAGCSPAREPEPANTTENTQPPESAPVTESAPVAEYDARTQTVYVSGTEDYASITLPEEIKSARGLEVQGEDLKLGVYLAVLREDGMDVETELPGLVYRTAESLRFIRQYLRENAGEAYPAGLAELPVEIDIDRAYGYAAAEDKITLKYNERGTHREFLYLLALMNGGSVGWEQFGYAWYVGTCLNPYTEVTDKWPIVPELPYYEQCIAGGIDPENVTPADYRTVYDACARLCFDKGLTHWGSLCESAPVTEEPGFLRTQAQDPGDTLLTAFTAASFLAWLDEAYGFGQVSLFCFGKKTFAEAFGVNFSVAYKEWRLWITDNYPASGQ